MKTPILHISNFSFSFRIFKFCRKTGTFQKIRYFNFIRPKLHLAGRDHCNITDSTSERNKEQEDKSIKNNGHEIS